MKNKTKKSTGMALELIGGIYIVEKYKDGTEKREEIDGEKVLQMLLKVIEDYADKVIAKK